MSTPSHLQQTGVPEHGDAPPIPQRNGQVSAGAHTESHRCPEEPAAAAPEDGGAVLRWGLSTGEEVPGQVSAAVREATRYRQWTRWATQGRARLERSDGWRTARWRYGSHRNTFKVKTFPILLYILHRYQEHSCMSPNCLNSLQLYSQSKFIDVYAKSEKCILNISQML